MRIDLDMDEMLEGMTRDGMKKFVKKLLSASESEEKKMLGKMGKEKNDLADLDEEMHGKPNTPLVEDDDLPDDDEDLPEVPKKGKK
jgi:uncharacterized membrane protein (DUF106 family)